MINIWRERSFIAAQFLLLGFVLFSISRKVDKASESISSIKESVVEMKLSMDTSICVSSDIVVISLNRANALWNGWMGSDSILRFYFGDPPGKYIHQYEVDSLRAELKKHLYRYHRLRK